MSEKAMRGDRSAYDVENYPEKHASDIDDGNALYHLPAPGTVGNIPIDDGTNWTPRKLVDADLPNPYTLKAPSILTISSGSVTPTKNNHIIAAESGTTDDLTTIVVGTPTPYQLLLLKADTGDTITIKTDVVNIKLDSGVDFVLSGDKLLLVYCDGTDWFDISSAGGGSSLTVEEEDADPTVASVTKIKVTNGSLTDLGSNEVLITIPGSDAIPLKLSDIEAYQRFVITAHRGDINPIDGYPEDTLEACLAAARKGAQRIEVDPRLTSDGTLYLMHDATVDRTTDGTGNVVDKTDVEMDALNIDAGYGYRAVHSGLYHPPTLQSVMEAVAPYGVTVQLDATASGADLAAFVVANNWQEWVVITCANQADAQAVKAVDSNLVVMGPNGETGWAELDIVQYAWASLPSEATVLSLAPHAVSIYMDIADYDSGTEEAMTQTIYDRGARYCTSHDIDASLQILRRELYLPDVPYLVDNYNPDAYPIVSNAMDDEFVGGGSINGKWTKVNDPAGADALNQTIYEGFLHVGLLELGTDNYDNTVRLYQTPPAYSNVWEFVVKAAITVTGLATEYGEFCGIHLYLGNSVNDEFVTVDTYVNDSAQATSFVHHRAGSGADNGSGGFTGMTTNFESGISPGQFVYLKLKKTTTSAYTSANTYEAYVSTNGITWTQAGTISKTFTTACDEIGLMFRRPKSQTGTPKGEGLVDFFRRTV